MPAVLVAHELADAQAFANRLAVLDRGGVLQIGEPGPGRAAAVPVRVAELVGYLGFAAVAGRPEWWRAFTRTGSWRVRPRLAG